MLQFSTFEFCLDVYELKIFIFLDFGFWTVQKSAASTERTGEVTGTC